jgi:alkaline phosphatase D
MKRQITRRSFLVGTAGGLIVACSDSGTSTPPPVTTAQVGSSTTTTTASTLPPGPTFASNPFTLGVASGDPAADSVMLWTRLAPDPTAPAGGMDPEPVTVGWQVGSDEDLATIVASGEAVADSGFGHSIHVELGDLQPAQTYWYRFFVGDHESEIARTRTTPAPSSMASQLVLGHVSCQNHNQGYWTAYDDLATADLDAVLHCGDYVYERNSPAVRDLDLPEPTDLAGYRGLYAAYKSDLSLRAAHAIAPWIVTWDDHEVENNYQGDFPSEGTDTPDPQDFLDRRAAAYRAWWENMPVRLPSPTGPSWAMHRGVDFGQLVSLSVLDTRQYRSDQHCEPSDIGPRCDDAFDDDFTVLGTEQETWLRDRLGESDARYTLLQQGVVMQQWRFLPGNTAWNLDQWDGYPAARRRLFDDIQAAGSRNPIVLTGDVHSSWVGSLAVDFDDPDSEIVGTEFVGTSISSTGAQLEPLIDVVLGQSPHVEWAQAQRRGWTRHTVTPDQWEAEYREVDDVTVANAPVSTSTRWVVPDGGTVTEA